MLGINSFIGAHDRNWEDEDIYSHPHLEITIVLEGRCRFRGEEQERVVEAGQIVLIPPHYPHSFHAVSAVRFGVLLIDGLSPRIRELFDRLIVDGGPRMITLSRLDQDHYERLFRQWLRIHSSPLKEPERNYMAWIEVMLLFLNEHSHSDQQALSIAHTGDYIREHLQQSIPISALAEEAGLSEEGFRKQFYKVYGVTPKQYQQMCRLAEAKWLLSSSEKSMQAIADMIGFTKLHSFSLWFKKMEGCPPTEWRARQRLYHD
ncbi:AraC family transcriptional regulator [Paenibacillus sp. J5C_2022]|uniref:helix-turn-helix domain-containing protein n=1 Tax=Paenibacillus sp. J5C2022 TaxID=2977129 RepID=UPI0021CED926|nr:AraC family transcriptional regulator [Paenibacillus sp. J5C2022]MCU6711577.1 AraC family transcriptional regulator [Paenibacillus sp. J5C2022]